MFYRVDYMLAVLLAGFALGFLLSKTLERITPSRLAQRYYEAAAVVWALRIGVFICAMLLSHQSVWTTIGGIVGDLLSLLFGALFGLASRRNDAREFLTAPSILNALFMGLAFTFALAGVGKALSMAPMTDFFTQSGYSVSFLKFIMIAEVFGAIGLLLPWAVLPSLLGLSIDMFGAVLTHIHNGDPLNDSTGAIGMLIRLLVIGVLWTLRRRDGGSLRPVRSSLLRVAMGTTACLLIAIGGSIAVRHLTPLAPTVAAPTSH